jgi:anaerobic magnesium-protoporphyrin IX monomethyl ester cyclase
MRRVLLINANTETAPYPSPPVGVCLAASLIEREHEVIVFDGTFRAADALRGVIEDFRPDTIGIGIRNVDNLVIDDTIFYIDGMLERLAGPLACAPEATVILGGAGYSLFPVELLELFQADFGIVGEAESSLPALLRALDAGASPETVPGIVARSGNGIVRTPRGPGPHSLEIPFSRIDLKIDYGAYVERGAYPVQTRRGCGQRCLYCAYPLIEGGGFRLRSPAAVVDEMQDAMQRLGGVTFEFVDSTFSKPPGHAEALCREVMRRKLDVRMRTMGINPADVTDRLVGLMKDAGFSEIDCTPDSASPQVLERLRKGFTRRALETAAALIRRHDLPAKWFFLFGGPGETEETVADTFGFIEEHIGEDDMVYMSEGLRIYPGTGLQALALREGIVSAEESLFRPKFYISPELGRPRLGELLKEASERLPSCLHCSETRPSPAMLRKAVELRREQKLAEPMFRTLMRLRRQGWR